MRHVGKQDLGVYFSPRARHSESTASPQRPIHSNVVGAQNSQSSLFQALYHTGKWQDRRDDDRKLGTPARVGLGGQYRPVCRARAYYFPGHVGDLPPKRGHVGCSISPSVLVPCINYIHVCSTPYACLYICTSLHLCNEEVQVQVTSTFYHVRVHAHQDQVTSKGAHMDHAAPATLTRDRPRRHTCYVAPCAAFSL